MAAVLGCRKASCTDQLLIDCRLRDRTGLQPVRPDAKGLTPRSQHDVIIVATTITVTRDESKKDISFISKMGYNDQLLNMR